MSSITRCSLMWRPIRISALVATCTSLCANSVSLRARYEKVTTTRHDEPNSTVSKTEHLDETPKHNLVGASRESLRIRSCVDRYADELDVVELGLGGIIRTHPLVPATVSNRRVIIGAGSGNTGTHSIYHALQEFGFATWHAAKNETWDKKRGKIRAILDQKPQKGNRLAQVLTDCQHELRTFNYTWLLDGCDAVVDMPTAEMFLDLFLAFPDALAILSTRPSSAWAEARMRTHPGTAAPIQEPCADISSHEFSSDGLARLFESNNDLVRCLVPPERLLELDFWADSSERVQGMMGELLRFVADARPPMIEQRMAVRHKFPHISPHPRKIDGGPHDAELFRNSAPWRGGHLVQKRKINGSLEHVNPSRNSGGRKHHNSGIHEHANLSVVELKSCEENLVRHNARRLPDYRDFFVEASELARQGCELI